MHTLKGQEIFAAGEWNGQTFSEGDLDSIVASFEALQLKGRVPLKFGHGEPSGAPALGWVSRVWREGKKLLADFADVPDKVMQLIHDRAYKHVSVELLRETRAGTRMLPWVLDAVALLGAEQPAVGILKELTFAHLRGGKRFCFTVDIGEPETMGKEIDELRATVARQHAMLLQQTIEADISLGACLPAARHGFCRIYKLTSDPQSWQSVTLDDWKSFRATQRVPGPSGVTSLARTDSESQRMASDPGQRVADLREEYAESQGLDLSDTRQFDKATLAIFKRHPELAQAWSTSNGVF